jgi:hypothetical protein
MPGMHQANFGQQEVAIPGQAHLQLRIYGPVKATNVQGHMAQAFTVLKDGVPTARAELEAVERQAAEQLLIAEYPEHARLL